jgi:hypothetical protein
MSNDERAFLDEIVCEFPYDDLGQGLKLIDRGIAISPEAAYGVLHEICRPPRGARFSPADLVRLIEYWRSHFDHPAAGMLADVATSMVGGRDLTVDDVIAKMKALSEYPRQYSALAIVYFACDDQEGKLEPIREEIRRTWRALPIAPTN